MSGLIAAAQPVNIIQADDVRHVDEYWFGRDDLVQPPTIIGRQWEEEREFQGFTSPWWPRAGGLLGDAAGDVNPLTQPAWWGEAWHQGGASSRLAFVGYARDWAGNVLPSATVRCFLTSTVELVSTVSSDANGYYAATTPYGGAHFLTVHGTASGVPVSGASVDTLVPG